MENEIEPKVSVCVMTYNQEEYIAQCLRSIIEQKTDFPFEVIISDDCSTDSTPTIIREFSNQFPNLIKTVLHPKNIGVSKNYRSAHDLARGEYIAHCDGDDAWLPGKLAYQAALLDQNPYASQCWTCAELVNDQGKKIGIFPSRLARIFYPSTITASDIALSYALVGQHSTQMYRRKFKFNFDSNQPILDFWIAFNLALHGPALYSKKIFGQYRVTSTPSMTRSSSKRRATVDFLALHLTQIIQKHPKFASEAKANLLSRHFFSRVKRHDLSTIEEAIMATKNVSCRFIHLVRALTLFALQKI